MSRATVWKTWVKPEVYPIVVAVSSAVTFGLYAGTRCLYKSPEVLLDKSIRNDQMAESDWFEEKSSDYKKSFFRDIAEKYGRRSVFPNDTGVHR